MNWTSSSAMSTIEHTSTTPSPTVNPLDNPAVGAVVNESLADMNLTTTTDYFTIYGSATFYVVLLVFALICVNLFLFLLIRGYSTFKEYPFFMIVWQLVITNELHLLVQISTVVPLLFFSVADSPGVRLWNRIGGVLIDFSDQSATFFTLLIALNRFSIFVFPQLFVIFQKAYLWLTISCTWTIIVSITAAKNFLGLTRAYDSKKKAFMAAVAANNLINTIFNVIGYVLPFIIFILYIFIFVNIRGKRATKCPNVSRQDRSLLYQATMIACILEVSMVTNTIIIPMISTDITWLAWLLEILFNVLTIINHTVNSFMFLTANKIVRGILFGLVGKELEPTTSDSDQPLRRVDSDPRRRVTVQATTPRARTVPEPRRLTTVV